MKDLQQYAADRLNELLDIKGFADADDVVSQIEDLEDDFDGDSYCPYYHQQTEIIDDYEREFGDEAEDLLEGGKTYTAAQWQEAKMAYAYAVAYCAFTSYFAAAKQELIEGIQEFVIDAIREFALEDEPQIRVSSSSVHGWAAHDREYADGTMIFTSRQLDGCVGMERKIGRVWVSCCFDPSASLRDDAE